MRPPPHQPLLPLELALIYPISAAAPYLRALDPSLAAPLRSPLIGSLCSGYGGLDLSVQAALGGTLAWHAVVDRNASRILARHPEPGRYHSRRVDHRPSGVRRDGRLHLSKTSQ